MNDFRSAVERKDLDGLLALMTEDVVFRSPIVFKPYRGRDQVGTLLRAVIRVLEDFRYDREIGEQGDENLALVFRARVGEREVEGCDFLHFDSDGLIDEFFVMVRPLSAALAVAEAMKNELEAAGGAPA
jgi:ketosteroid isomerase-like protein